MLKKIAKSLQGQAKGVMKEMRLKARAQTEPKFGRTELAEGFRNLGLVPGDTVFVHSSLKSLGYVDGGPIAVFEGLWDVIGPDGTMIVPTYYLPGGTIANAAKQDELRLRSRGARLEPRRTAVRLPRLPRREAQPAPDAFGVRSWPACRVRHRRPPHGYVRFR
jgi:aminoglycoside 3-N-acetyltransferase